MINQPPINLSASELPPAPRMRDELKGGVDLALPQTPGQFGEHRSSKNGARDIDPQTALLVTLDYDYTGIPQLRSASTRGKWQAPDLCCKRCCLTSRPSVTGDWVKPHSVCIPRLTSARMFASWRRSTSSPTGQRQSPDL